MSKAASINKINQTELSLGIAGTNASWHAEYSSSPTIFIGGLATSHTEQHILSIFEQFGTLTHVNLVRDAQTNQSRQFAFANYADARSAVLAVDNLNAVQIDGSTLCVDHVNDYRMPQPAEQYDTTPVGFATPVTDTRSGTPSEDSLANANAPTSASTPIHVARQLQAERKRKIGVFARLEKLRKIRRIERQSDDNEIQQQPPQQQPLQLQPPQQQPRQQPASSVSPISDSHPTIAPQDSNLSHDDVDPLPSASAEPRSNSRLDRQRHRIEKERRRAERAAIRQARAERRARSRRNR